MPAISKTNGVFFSFFIEWNRIGLDGKISRNNIFNWNPHAVMLKNVAHIHIDWYNYSANARYASQKRQFLIQNHQYHLQTVQSASLNPLALGKLKTKTDRTSMCMCMVHIVHTQVCVCVCVRCDAMLLHTREGKRKKCDTETNRTKNRAGCSTFQQAKCTLSITHADEDGVRETLTNSI